MLGLGKSSSHLKRALLGTLGAEMPEWERLGVGRVSSTAQLKPAKT